MPGAAPVSYREIAEQNGTGDPAHGTLPDRNKHTGPKPGDLYEHLLSLKGQDISIFYRDLHGGHASWHGTMINLLTTGNEIFIQLYDGLIINLKSVDYLHPGSADKYQKKDK